MEEAAGWLSSKYASKSLHKYPVAAADRAGILAFQAVTPLPPARLLSLLFGEGGVLNWWDLCENPRGITTYYRAPPSLDDVIVRELGLAGGVPSIEFWIELQQPPDKAWPDWNDEAYVPTLVLQLWPLSAFSLSGWGPQNRGSLHLDRGQEGDMRFSFDSDKMKCSGTCEHAMIVTFRPVKRT